MSVARVHLMDGSVWSGLVPALDMVTDWLAGEVEDNRWCTHVHKYKHRQIPHPTIPNTRHNTHLIAGERVSK